MIRIALVGSIGSGKTFISNLFGYPVFNADKSVSKIYSNNKKIFYKLKKRLPKFFTDPPIKKEELIKAIVKNKNSLNIISKIVHPEVRKDLQKFIKKHNKKKAIVLDIPLFWKINLTRKKTSLYLLNLQIQKCSKD
jgi:dephospho-CoA kinase